MAVDSAALLERGADPQVTTDYFEGRTVTPLMLAAQTSKVNRVQALLKAGADPTTTDGDGRTVADYAKGKRGQRIREVLANG